MRKLLPVLFCIGALTSLNANAFFFFFIPTGAIADLITGSKGDICVKDGMKEGDIQISEAGNSMKIISTSGTSSRCPNPALPIRAEVEFTLTSASKAGIELSDNFEVKPLNDVQRYNGLVLSAKSKSIPDEGVLISFIKRKPATDISTMANITSNRKISFLKEAKSLPIEDITINGLRAIRFETIGNLPGVGGINMTYITTFLEDKDEIVMVDAYCKTSILDSTPQVKTELINIAQNIKGLSGEIINAPTFQPEVKTNPPSIESTTSSKKLKDLKSMLDKGLISQKDYDLKKQEILKSM